MDKLKIANDAWKPFSYENYDTRRLEMSPFSSQALAWACEPKDQGNQPWRIS